MPLVDYLLLTPLDEEWRTVRSILAPKKINTYQTDPITYYLWKQPVKRPHPYERDRYGSGQERDYPYGHGAGEKKRYRSERDQYSSSQERNNEYDHDRYGSGEERDWWDRASDAVATWFGDEEAERRRRMDQHQEQYRGRGPKGYRRSDERINEDVNDRLSDDYYLDASDIEVVVTNGELTLVGMVNSRADKRRAEDIAESVAGVTNVENRLRVKQSMFEGYRSTEFTGTTAAPALRQLQSPAQRVRRQRVGPQIHHPRRPHQDLNFTN